METHKEKTDDITNYNGGLIFMDKIQRCVDHLIESIKEGDAYQRYLSCEEKLKEHPELRRKIDEFRLAAYRLNNEL